MAGGWECGHGNVLSKFLKATVELPAHLQVEKANSSVGRAALSISSRPGQCWTQDSNPQQFAGGVLQCTEVGAQFHSSSCALGDAIAALGLCVLILYVAPQCC